MGWIVILAAIASIIAFILWNWIEVVVLPRHSGHYLKYSIVAGVVFAFFCLFAFIAFAVSQNGERLIPVGIILGGIMGLIVSIGTAISYWIPEFISKRSKRKRGNES